jgi:hypothetical protein
VIEEFKHVGTHADQYREGRIAALAEAGIGRAYEARTLEDLGEPGAALKRFILERLPAIRSEGHGFDFRGGSPVLIDTVMLTARAMLHVGLSTRVLPLVRLPKLLGDADEAAILQACGHLVIRDWETHHENPLRPYEIALVEAFVEDRLADNRAVSVTRRDHSTKGWWGQIIEDALDQRNRQVLV